MRLFFFGTLLDPDLFALVVGRPIDAVTVKPGVLHGFRRRKVKGEHYPILAPHPGGRVDGLLIDGLTEAEIDRIRFFEGEDYALRPLPVTDAEGRPAGALACVSTGTLEEAGEAWHLEAWAATEKARAFVQSEELMALYGTMTVGEMDARWDEIKERAERRYEAMVERRHEAARARKAGWR